MYSRGFFAPGPKNKGMRPPGDSTPCPWQGEAAPASPPRSMQDQVPADRVTAEEKTTTIRPQALRPGAVPSLV